MLANWAVGKETCIDDFGRILEAAPFDCVVMVLTSAVAETDDIDVWLSELEANRNDENNWKSKHPQLAKVHYEKAVYKCSRRVSVAIHRAKVKVVMYVERFKGWEWESSGKTAVAETPPDINFGTQPLRMDQTLQRYARMKLGILYMEGLVERHSYTSKLVDWIVSDKLAPVTGHFGENRELVADIAAQPKAINFEPLYQQIQWQDPQSRQWRDLTFPNCFCYLGFFAP